MKKLCEMTMMLYLMCIFLLILADIQKVILNTSIGMSDATLIFMKTANVLYQSQFFAVHRNLSSHTQRYIHHNICLFHRSSGNSEFSAGGEKAVDVSASRATETDRGVDSTCEYQSGVTFYNSEIAVLKLARSQLCLSQIILQNSLWKLDSCWLWKKSAKLVLKWSPFRSLNSEMIENLNAVLKSKKNYKICFKVAGI